MANSKRKEGKGQSSSMVSAVNPETTQAYNSEENEHEDQEPAGEAADPEKEKIYAEKDRILECLLKAVEERRDEIFAPNDAPNNDMAFIQPPPPPASRSEPRNRNRGIVITEIQEPPSPKIAPSNNVAELPIRKNKRKQNRPCRAPTGDGLEMILELADRATAPLSPAEVPAPAKATQKQKNRKKKRQIEKETTKWSVSESAWTWGREQGNTRKRSLRVPVEEITEAGTS